MVPGHDRRKIEGVHGRGADFVIFDLEDSVPPGRKDEARELVELCAWPFDGIRANPVGSTEFELDLAMASRVGALVMIPKVELADLAQIEAGYILSIESPSAVLDARAIAAHSAGIAFGRHDFMSCCGITDNWSPLIEYSMVQVALAAKAAGVVVSDAPCYSITDGDLLVREIDRAKQYGFSSKCCIHPNQVAACERLGPGADELLRAEMLIANWESACPITIRDGSMSGPPDYRGAMKMVGLA